MAEEKTTKQVNVNFEKYPELLKALDLLVQAEESDRSKVIRKLIRREALIRQLMPSRGDKQSERRVTAV